MKCPKTTTTGMRALLACALSFSCVCTLWIFSTFSRFKCETSLFHHFICLIAVQVIYGIILQLWQSNNSWPPYSTYSTWPPYVLLDFSCLFTIESALASVSLLIWLTQLDILIFYLILVTWLLDLTIEFNLAFVFPLTGLIWFTALYST